MQCAQANVARDCIQNRRTIGCVRCNAQRLACSYRTGEQLHIAPLRPSLTSM